MNETPLASFLEWLENPLRRDWKIAFRKDFPARAAELEPIPETLNPAVIRLLQRDGLVRLYSHQAEAIRAALNGQNVVSATETASGKSLAYQAPVLHTLIQNPNTTALLVFPLKALERDQRDAFLALCHGTGITVAVFDGDTPETERRRIKSNPPRVLITNPDMLHLGLLPHHHVWRSFFAHLCWVVLDEVHTYKGVFGSHIAQVIIRLLRVCQHYGSSPRFLASSATIANPGGFTSCLIGQETVVVERSGAPQSPKSFVFINPVLSPYTVASRVFIHALKRGLKTIVFTRARRVTELITRWVLDAAPELRGRISSYRAGFLPEERREIEARLFAGDMDGVISTSALEMGIDVGALDVCLLVGYPGTIINTRQRGGRVGRGGKPSAVVLIAATDALDQYFIRNPQDFFERNCEEAVLDPLNPEILKRHIPCAAAELPIRPDEPWCHREPIPSILKELEDSGILYQRGDGAWCSTVSRPQRDVDLRGVGSAYSIFLENAKTPIGTSTGIRVFTECHEGAVYLHRTRQYVVTKLDLKRKNVFVRPDRSGYYTRALSQKDTEILGAPIRTRDFPGFRVREARLKVTERVIAYEKRRTADQTLLGIVDMELPPVHFETVGIWIEIPDAVKDFINRLQLHFMGGIHALEHAAISLFPLFALCDRDDIGGIAMPEHPQVCRAAVFLYDGYAGGVGLAHRAFDVVDELLQKTRLLVDQCPCEAGCPSCIHSPKCGNGNKPLDKHACLAVLDCLLHPETMALRLRNASTSAYMASARLCSASPWHPPDIFYGIPPRFFPDLGTLPHTISRKRVETAVTVEAENRSYLDGSQALLVPTVDGRNLPGLLALEQTPESLVSSAEPPPGFSEKQRPLPSRGSRDAKGSRPRKKTKGGRKIVPMERITPYHLLADFELKNDAGNGPAQQIHPQDRMKQPERIVFFDLETQRLAREVGGWSNASHMKLALGVVYTEQTGFSVFREAQVQDLITLLTSADLVVGFNHLDFDYEVLRFYTTEDLRALPNLDIFREVHAELGVRLSLDHLAEITLGRRKKGKGFQAVQWYRDGQWDILEEYCREDVILIRDLYRFGVKYGFLLYRKKDGAVAPIRVNWHTC